MPRGRQPGGIPSDRIAPLTTSPLRLALVSALFGLQFGAQAATQSPQVITFDTTPRAGQHQRQLIDMQMTMKSRLEAGPAATDEQRAKIAQAAENMARTGLVKVTMKMAQTTQVGQPDAEGWLPLTVSSAAQGGQIEAGGRTMPMPPQANVNMSFTARFNPKDFAFELQQSQGTEFNELMRAQGQAMVNEALQVAKALGQRSMKPGDSIEVPMNMALPVPIPGGAGKMDAKLRYTLNRVDRGVAHFDLSMAMQMSLDAPLPAAAASAALTAAATSAPQTLNMQIHGNGTGTSSLRLSDRLPLASQLDMDVKMDMQGPDNGRMFMDMQMKMNAKGESLAKPAVAPAKKKS
jgi:hypothetical protein